MRLAFSYLLLHITGGTPNPPLGHPWPSFLGRVLPQQMACNLQAMPSGT